ncbi:hypothetical protein [Arthrobacter sp. OV608]|uniref:hypothetical protein n=1 Tax=Arthrobacter sp. OV608 TaxID=1882768 RepID=UPI0008B73162|nr:hypothetical protein [Arthrobacter sp. OV608]SEQ50559.1 hypothetical protein SAMN05444745_10759 [Arthrobacter sp. OV608]
MAQLILLADYSGAQHDGFPAGSNSQLREALFPDYRLAAKGKCRSPMTMDCGTSIR